MWRYFTSRERASLARIDSTVAVQMKGLGLSFHDGRRYGSLTRGGQWISLKSSMEDTVHAAEAHLAGITAKDVTAVPYHPDVIIETPLGPPIKGADAARQAVASVFPAVKEIRIIRHIVDGEWCATLFDFEYVFGTFRIIDVFHVVDGRIVSIQAYYDPRPILQGLQQFMPSR